MKLLDLKIGARLNLGFGVMLALLLAIAALGLQRMGAIQDNLKTIVDGNNVKVATVNLVLDSARNIAQNARDFILMTDETMMQGVDKEIAANRALQEKSVARLIALATAPEEKALMGKIIAERDIAMPRLNKAAAMGRANDTEAATKYMLEEARPALVKWIAAMDAMAEYETRQAVTMQLAAEASYRSARMLVLVLSGLAIFGGVLIAWFVARSITVPLQQALGVANTVASGDLSSRIEVNRSDETGQLLQALKGMNDSLRDIVGKVRGGTEQIATASNEIASGNMDLSSRTEQQAGSLEETASSMEELTSTVRQNADNARQANGLAQQASQVAVRGGQVVSQVVQTMGSINDSSRKIVDIIAVIDGIAFQTNILALNAAVEAARAGEQGRGFAVVASEVRNLAQRSASAAKEIKSLIDDSVAKVDAGSKLVDQAGTTMDEIVGSIQRVTDIMSEISAATAEQTAGIEQVNHAIAEMDAVTQQNAALVEQAAAAAAAMQDQAEELQTVVSAFKVGEAGTGRRLRNAPSSAVPRGQPARPALTMVHGARRRA